MKIILQLLQGESEILTGCIVAQSQKPHDVIIIAGEKSGRVHFLAVHTP